MTYFYVFTSGSRHACPYGAPEFTPVFVRFAFEFSMHSFVDHCLFVFF